MRPTTSSVLDAIGDTPCVPLNHIVPDGSARVFLKLEFFNPTGSYKDRMAKSIIEEAERQGKLQPGITVIEASGGSTGSSLAFVCAVKGYKFRVVTSNAFSSEKLRTMSAFGGQVDIVQSPSGNITPELLPTMIQRARSAAAEQQDTYYADQFNNADAFIGYEHMGNELVYQFPQGIDGFCGAVGGAGMLSGVSKVLKHHFPSCRILALEPESSPLLSQGRLGLHHVEGIGPGFYPPLLDKQLYDAAWGVPEEEARSMCQRLAREEGLLVGTSTGLNVVAALKLAKELGPEKTVVTVACDTGIKYMSGDLFTSE
ncbi:hypothetical protein NPX13_g3767 [Xylaria arbuscula]|uniref:Tryptophan synthase beta chain-like PALP domain-containing protein n=1 Tax=Xylaria arbuscula TaxID=114810 RepID=A0A9W8TMI4_9PEZI|nr:hypothetical protein NPX13_g3767 [Xylaria arbuscula]